MTILFYDGFLRYSSQYDVLTRINDNAAWHTGASAGLNIGSGRNGGNCMIGGYNSVVLNTPLATGAVQCAIDLNNSATFNIYLQDSAHGNGNQVTFTFNLSNGVLTATSGSNSWSTPNNTVPGPYTYFSFAAQVTIGASGTGSISAYINGVQVLNQPGVTTQQTAGTTFDTIVFTTIYGQYTDVCISTTLVGQDAYSIWIPALANGATDQFTPLSGANYTNVNGLTQIAKYNSSATVGNVDLFTLSNSSISGSTILSLEPGVQASRDNTGSHSMATYMRSTSGTLTTGTSYALSSTAIVFGTPYATDPATSSAWLTSALPQVGYKLAA
jgi:hypothetical protein